MAEQVETTAPEQGAATPATVPATTTPTPAPDVDALVKAAKAEAWREAQAAKDREKAALLKKHDQEIRALRDAAKGRLSQLGDEEVDRWDEELTIRQKARAYDELSAEAQNAAAWERFVRDTAHAYDLKPGDPRLEGATSAADLMSKAKAAFQENAEQAKAQARREAEEARKAAAQAKVDNGDLDTLTGPGERLPEGERLRKAYQEEKAKLRAGDVLGVTRLNQKYRKQGLKGV